MSLTDTAARSAKARPTGRVADRQNGAHVDLRTGEWRIPAERMKMNEDLIVPLSRQAVAVIQELQPQTKTGKYLFPSLQGAHRPMSENTINGALRRLARCGATL